MKPGKAASLYDKRKQAIKNFWKKILDPSRLNDKILRSIRKLANFKT
jgi:hypothetical protein